LYSASSVDKWRALASTSLGHLINDGWSMFVPLMADIIVNEKQTPLIVVTLISISFYSSSALLNFFIGHLADRKGRQGTVMATGIALISLAFLGFALALSFPSNSLLYFFVTAMAILAGLGSACYHPIAAAILQTSFGPGDSGKAMGLNGAFGQIGSAVFPPLFFALAIFVDQRNALALMTVLGLLGAVAIWRGLRAYKVVRDSADGERRRGAKDALTKGILVLTIITAVRSIANTGVSTWLPTYITFVKGEGVGSLLGFTLAAMYLGAIPGQLVFGTLVERLDKRYVLGASSAGAALAVLGYVFTGGYLALAFITLFGFFSFSSFPTLLSLASDYVPRSSWVAANGFVWGLGIMGGNVIGPALTQIIIGEDYSRLSFAFIVLAAIGIAGALVTPLMVKAKPEDRKISEKRVG
jgi:MFS transporter, FSR family, fosmidomycin resistance protein